MAAREGAFPTWNGESTHGCADSAPMSALDPGAAGLPSDQKAELPGVIEGNNRQGRRDVSRVGCIDSPSSIRRLTPWLESVLLHC